MVCHGLCGVVFGKLLENFRMTELQHHFVTTNGVKMHYVEQGSGPLVVMCHGWPESWYCVEKELDADPRRKPWR